MKFRVCSRCKTPTKKSDNPEYSYQCLHCDEDLYEFETEEIETIKAVNPVVIGSAKDGGFVGFHACDKMCMHCGGENYNIPVANVSLCVHCGVELLPCTACTSESADTCDFDLVKGGCYRFHHSDNFLAKQMARMLGEEIPLFIGDDVYIHSNHYTGKAKIVGNADDEYENFPDSIPGAWDDCYIIDCGDDVGTMTAHKSDLQTYYVYAENEGVKS